jgi:hypothetical protein
MLPQDLASFLVWLGGNVAFGMVSSWIAANVTAFQNLSSGWKSFVLFVLSAAMGIGSKLLVTYTPGSLIDTLNPYYVILLGSFIVVFGQQIWYAKVERPRELGPQTPGRDKSGKIIS